MQLTRLGIDVWPSRKHWLQSLAIAALGFLLIGAIGAATGLAEWRPQPLTPSILIIAGVLFVVPSLLEEMLFRGLLQSYLPMGALISWALFIAWHPLQHWTGIGPAWTAIFVQAEFLACVAVAGAIFAVQRRITGSIWPGVFSHWMLVLAWKLLFGGPF